MKVLLDIGAGQGLFSLAAAARGHQALAFELSAKSLASLEASVAFSSLSHLVHVHKVSLPSRPCTLLCRTNCYNGWGDTTSCSPIPQHACACLCQLFFSMLSARHTIACHVTKRITCYTHPDIYRSCIPACLHAVLAFKCLTCRGRSAKGSPYCRSHWGLSGRRSVWNGAGHLLHPSLGVPTLPQYLPTSDTRSVLTLEPVPPLIA